METHDRVVTTAQEVNMGAEDTYQFWVDKGDYVVLVYPVQLERIEHDPRIHRQGRS